MTAKTQLGQAGIVGILTTIVEIAKSLGWFTQRDWHPEICGNIIDNTAEGGILNALEEQTGEAYPELRVLLQDVVDSFRTFQWAAPWNKKSTAENYDAKLREFANAIKEKAEKWAEEHKVALRVTIWDWVKANFAYIGMGAGFATLIAVILLARKR